MTILQATRAEVLPYSFDVTALQKAIIDAGLEPDVDYTVSLKTNVARVAVTLLRSMLSLNAEGEGGFSQSYDPKGLKERIAAIETENSLPRSVGPRVIDRSNRW